MSTININIPDKIDTHISNNKELENIITDVIFDYIEKKEDQKVHLSLKKNSYFKVLNNSLESELGI